MPSELGYYYEKRVIYMRFYGVVTNEELRASNEMLLRLVAEGTPRIYILVDSFDMTKHESGLAEIRSIFNSAPLDVVAWIVLIGVDPLARFFASVVSQLLNMRFRFEKDRAAAVEFIRSVDDTLSNLSNHDYPAPETLSK